MVNLSVSVSIDLLMISSIKRKNVLSFWQDLSLQGEVTV